MPVGARSVALAGADLATVSGVDALFYNPAGIVATQNKTEVLFSNTRYIADMQLNFVGVTQSLGDFRHDRYQRQGAQHRRTSSRRRSRRLTAPGRPSLRRSARSAELRQGDDRPGELRWHFVLRRGEHPSGNISRDRVRPRIPVRHRLERSPVGHRRQEHRAEHELSRARLRVHHADSGQQSRSRRGATWRRSPRATNCPRRCRCPWRSRSSGVSIRSTCSGRTTATASETMRAASAPSGPCGRCWRFAAGYIYDGDLRCPVPVQLRAGCPRSARFVPPDPGLGLTARPRRVLFRRPEPLGGHDVLGRFRARPRPGSLRGNRAFGLRPWTAGGWPRTGSGVHSAQLVHLEDAADRHHVARPCAASTSRAPPSASTSANACSIFSRRRPLTSSSSQ